MAAPAFIANKIPPPVLALGAVLFMLWAQRWGQPLFIAKEIRWIAAGLFFLMGLGIEITAIWTFRQVKTTINPLKPQATARLVTQGIYQYSRNPMYVGLACQLLALVCFLAAPIALIGVALFVASMNWLQIEPEEAAMTKLFGQEYVNYQRQVRRWF